MLRGTPVCPLHSDPLSPLVQHGCVKETCKGPASQSPPPPTSTHHLLQCLYDRSGPQQQGQVSRAGTPSVGLGLLRSQADRIQRR